MGYIIFKRFGSDMNTAKETYFHNGQLFFIDDDHPVTIFDTKDEAESAVEESKRNWTYRDTKYKIKEVK